jgi:hypothetical protein
MVDGDRPCCCDRTATEIPAATGDRADPPPPRRARPVPMTAASRRLRSAPPMSSACQEASSELPLQVSLPPHQAPVRSGLPCRLRSSNGSCRGTVRPGGISDTPRRSPSGMGHNNANLSINLCLRPRRRPREIMHGGHPNRRRMGRRPGRAGLGCHESVLPAVTCSSACSQARRGHPHSVVFDEAGQYFPAGDLAEPGTSAR